jgi:hypothetical protein
LISLPAWNLEWLMLFGQRAGDGPTPGGKGSIEREPLGALGVSV